MKKVLKQYQILTMLWDMRNGAFKRRVLTDRIAT